MATKASIENRRRSAISFIQDFCSTVRKEKFEKLKISGSCCVAKIGRVPSVIIVTHNISGNGRWMCSQLKKLVNYYELVAVIQFAGEAAFPGDLTSKPYWNPRKCDYRRIGYIPSVLRTGSEEGVYRELDFRFSESSWENVIKSPFKGFPREDFIDHPN